MVKRLILFLFIVVVMALSVFLWLKTTSSRKIQLVEKKNLAHHVGLKDLNLSNIQITAFYFVPKDIPPDLSFNYQEVMKKSLTELKIFYSQQTQGNITINSLIYPKILVGNQTSVEYDTGSTGRGNPKALANISKEIEQRMPDLQAEFPEISSTVQEKSVYKVMIIFYEGVGSSATIFSEDQTVAENYGLENIMIGDMPAVLVSKFYFTQDGVSDYASSILAHEFGHTLGFEDGYNIDSGTPFTADIMGAGRNKPLEWTFVSFDNLRKLGLLF